MLKPAMKDLLANVNNRYLLVNLAAQRARDISEEALENEEKLNDKAVKLALDEIAAGMIKYCPGRKPEAPAPEMPETVASVDLDFGEDDEETAEDELDESDEDGEPEEE